MTSRARASSARPAGGSCCTGIPEWSVSAGLQLLVGNIHHPRALLHHILQLVCPAKQVAAAVRCTWPASRRARGKHYTMHCRNDTQGACWLRRSSQPVHSVLYATVRRRPKDLRSVLRRLSSLSANYARAGSRSAAAARSVDNLESPLFARYCQPAATHTHTLWPDQA